MFDLQTKLKQQGFYKDKVDGLLGKATKRALTQYQKVKNIAYDGYTIQSLKMLGVKF